MVRGTHTPASDARMHIGARTRSLRHACAYVCICICAHTHYNHPRPLPLLSNIRQHTSAYVSIRQHMSGCMQIAPLTHSRSLALAHHKHTHTHTQHTCLLQNTSDMGYKAVVDIDNAHLEEVCVRKRSVCVCVCERARERERMHGCGGHR